MQKTVINKKENPGASAATPFFKKEKSSSFFDGNGSAFFNNNNATNVQRKCAHCEQEEKKQHKEENEEEQGKEVQLKPIFESGDDNIIQRDPDPVVPPPGNCPSYDTNEVTRSRTAAGWLPQDFTVHSADQFLLADFGNNHSNVKSNIGSEALWTTWKNTFQTDGSYRIQITGYSDCSGDEVVNTTIRHARAANVERNLGPRIARKLSFRGMAALGQFVNGNDTPENRARNRGVLIKHKQGFFYEVEAVANATESEAAIRTALAELGTSTEARERNVPAYIAQHNITISALTPRHEGTVVTPTISFFPGTNYAETFVLPQATRFHIYNSNANIAVQTRDMPNIEAMANIYYIKERIVQAISQISHLAAAGPAAAATTFEQYKAQFNAWWFVMPFRGMMPEFDPALSSFGPRTHRAREIFEKIYAENATVKNEYDNNTGGIKEKIDSYNIPDGYNRINSPRLEALRNVFLSNLPPISNANYPAFKTAIENASVPLDGDDRTTVARSNDWYTLINRYVAEEAKRTELRDIINSHHGAPAAPVIPGPPPVAPAVGGGQIRRFLDNIRIEGPRSPINSFQTSEGVLLTPKSNRPNPGINLKTRFTLDPAARVLGNHISAEENWGIGQVRGTGTNMEISNTGTVTMTAHLDILNLPAGITAPVVPDYQFTINDTRQADVLANWQADTTFNTSGGGSQWFQAGATIRYVSGGQQFNISVSQSTGRTNPGLGLSVVARLKQGGVVVQNNAGAPQPYPNGAERSTAVLFNVLQPAAVPPAGDPYEIEVDLRDAGGTVLGTKTINLTVLPELVFTQADAIRSATEDNAFFHDNSATGLLGIMTARGGLTARVAAAANTTEADGGITVMPLTTRHDSAEYVRTSTGNADASKAGFFMGVDYTHSMVDIVTAVGFYNPNLTAVGNKVVVLNRTTDISTNTKRSNDSVIESLVHEAIHAMDVRPNRDSVLERYKTEFRAFWMSGDFGPPDQPACPPGPIGNCRDAAFDQNLMAPGPRSARARAIFSHLYSSYDFVKENYDTDPDFRVQVDNYIYPDGINLLASVRLERLRAIIEAYGGANFAALRTQVRQHTGADLPAPAGGVLDVEERAQIRSSRAWRDLIERKVTVAADQLTLKGDLGIPVAP